MKTQDKVLPEALPNISKDDRIIVLGSCFAANIGERLQAEGYSVLVNPFGTLFNPASIAISLLRLQSGEHFTPSDCVQMGAGSNLWCSFSHYTKFARESKEEFLSNANEALEAAADFFRTCSKVIITFGTAYVFRHESGPIVANCLKRPAKEFERFALGVEQITGLYERLFAPDGPLACKDVIFTVSPVRHLADGAHGNQLSKAALLLSEDALVRKFSNAYYFPSYEILLDELRDFSFYAPDTVHPSEEAVEIICSRFLGR